MKKHGTTIILLLVLIVGLSLLLYPSLSNWWNSMHQSRAVASYVEQVANLDEDQYAHLWDEVWNYNRELTKRPNSYILNDQQRERYDKLLDVGGTGIMGYVEIPSIGVTLPIYHGTDETVLQIAVGHLEWTSLPVGGESSHCVVSGHRGLPSAKLFTDLDELVMGDIFMFRVLDEILTEGYDAMEGAHIVPDAGYVAYKNKLPGAAEYSNIVQDEGITFEDYTQFQARNSVERARGLIAVHNLTEEKLAAAIKLGGFPMPSIAIAKTSIGHQNFGPI